MSQRRPVTDEEVNRIKLWLGYLRDNMTDDLNQNGTVMANARHVKDVSEKLVRIIGTPEHPGYALAMLAFQHSNNILRAEEEEDLRQKGVNGLGEKLLPGLYQILEEYPHLIAAKRLTEQALKEAESE